MMRAPDPDVAKRLMTTLRGLFRFWRNNVAAALVFTVIFGAFPPVLVAAFILTLAMPIIALVIWGRSLDEELGWMDEDEGPW